ncbi:MULTISPECIES: PAAR domain-containing protein [unclassified Streptomyces]|uniref:PAAR domain-containing protein n=1 Tax=unclassified Streptomyces TaxID=2593676 RepID=UPI00344B887D
MPPAARSGDSTAHGGVIGTPPPGAVAVATVWIGGRIAAVTGSLVPPRPGSLHACVVPPHAALGPGNVIMPSPAAALSGQVLIGGLPAARVGDKTTCGAQIISGAPNVLIGGPM